jgi:hypothetical protein
MIKARIQISYVKTEALAIIKKRHPNQDDARQQ